MMVPTGPNPLIRPSATFSPSQGEKGLRERLERRGTRCLSTLPDGTGYDATVIRIASTIPSQVNCFAWALMIRPQSLAADDVTGLMEAS